MPMPVSRMVRVLASVLGMMSIWSFFSESRTEGSVRDWYLTLSRASDELEISSRRKISLLE